MLKRLGGPHVAGSHERRRIRDAAAGSGLKFAVLFAVLGIHLVCAISSVAFAAGTYVAFGENEMARTLW
jgi:hypothetical protein